MLPVTDRKPVWGKAESAGSYYFRRAADGMPVEDGGVKAEAAACGGTVACDRSLYTDGPTATIPPCDERIEPRDGIDNQCGLCGRDVSTCTCDFGV